MTPPRLLGNRVFVGLNLATLLIYGGLAIMFFLLSFDLIDRRALSPTDAGLVFLPFTLGVGLLSRPFGALADTFGARTMLIGGPLGAALAFALLALGKSASLALGVLAPMALFGISFAALVAPLTAQVLSSVGSRRRGARLRHQQCGEPYRAIGRHCALGRRGVIFARLSSGPRRRRRAGAGWRRRQRGDAAAGTTQAGSTAMSKRTCAHIRPASAR